MWFFFLHSFKKNNAMYRSGNIEIFFHILTCYKIVLIDSVKNDFQKFRALWLAIAKLVLILSNQNGESDLTKSI